MPTMTAESRPAIAQADAYTIEKVTYGQRKSGAWGLTCNGEPVMSEYANPGRETWDRKRDALAAIPLRIARQEYEARILAEDETGHKWTDDESKQIADYAQRLRENAVKRSLWGDTTPQAEGRREHFGELNTLYSHYAFGGDPGPWSRMVCAEIRRRRAGRVQAFHMAGAVLDQNYYTLTLQRTNHPTKTPEPHTSTHPSIEAAENELKGVLARCGQGETYAHTIDTVAPHWPHVCVWARPEIITITLGKESPDVEAVLHRYTVTDVPYTLRVISKRFDEPSGYHPSGTWWYTCERTHGMHL